MNDHKARDYERIHTATAFACGDQFTSEAQVRTYFTVAEQREIFCDWAVFDQTELDEYADMVIEHRWHCDF